MSSSTAYSAVKYYYYLQVGSFQKAQDAKHLAEKLRKVKENTIIRGEEASGLGYSYSVYLGPFSSWQGANSKLFEQTKKGRFFEHTYIQKKKSRGSLLGTVGASVTFVPLATPSQVEKRREHENVR